MGTSAGEAPVVEVVGEDEGARRPNGTPERERAVGPRSTGTPHPPITASTRIAPNASRTLRTCAVLTLPPAESWSRTKRLWR